MTAKQYRAVLLEIQKTAKALVKGLKGVMSSPRPLVDVNYDYRIASGPDE